MSLPPQSISAADAGANSHLSDSYIFDWRKLSLRTDWIFVIAIAICLAMGLASGHPGAGVIAAGAAVTTGFGAKYNIDDSRLLPMIFVSLGIAFSTFVGMVVGHRQILLVLLVALWGFGCGMLSSRPSGYAWVGQQCVVFLLVASAFPARPVPAAARAAVTLAGGAVQILCTGILLRLLKELRASLLSLAQYIRTEELLLGAAIVQTAESIRSGKMKNSSLPYSLRLAVTLAAGTAIYIALHFPSGYWIPMTSLFVLKPGIRDTTNRAIARTLGAFAGAIVASFFIAQIEPSRSVVVGCTLLFAWLTYATTDVNYALFSVCLTAYIVFLLSFAGSSSSLVAQRRAWCTAVGGALALGVRLFMIGHRKRSRIRSLRAAPEGGAGNSPVH